MRYLKIMALRLQAAAHYVDEYLAYWRGHHQFAADCNARALECERLIDLLSIQA